MSAGTRSGWLGGALAAAAVIAAWIALPPLREAAFWREQASPGALTPGHAFLAGRCDACHARLASVPPARCIACHADAPALLQRQPTAFHAGIGACTECHKEHQGREGLRTRMDHETLARLGRARLEAARPAPRGPGSDPAPPASALACSGCHGTKDRHRGFFGADCGACHATTQWRVAGFRHPSPASRACAQCHRAPPSHYMEHFAMVSQRIARRERTPVRECFECHRTSAWNDIRGVGFYKHH